MSFEATGAAIALWAASFVSFVTAATAWRMRARSPGGVFLAAMLAGVVIWSLMSGMEASAVELSGKVLFSKLGYVGVCSVAPLFVTFAFVYGGRCSALTPLRAVFVWAVPIATLLLALTNEWHHLVWSAFIPAPAGAGAEVLYVHGPWFWVWVLYAGFATVAATTVLAQSPLAAHRRFYMRQTFVFLAGAALPWIGTAVYLSPQNPFPGLDFPSLGFALSGGLLLLGVLRFRLLDIVPVPRIYLVDKIAEGLIVLDARDRIVDLNPAAQRILGLGTEAIGCMAGSEIRAIQELVAAVPGELRTHMTFHGKPDRHFDIVVTPLTRAGGTETGRILVLRESLPGGKESMPFGFLPICASCRKVRNEAGEWQSLERYVAEHSPTTFSHGLCNDCISKLYPEVDMGKPLKDPDS